MSKSQDSTAVAEPPAAPPPPVKRAPAPPPQRPPSAAGSSVPARPAAAAVNGSRPPTPAPSGPSTHPGCVDITLGRIEPSLPEALRHKIAGALQEIVPVPNERIVPQLRSGSVNISVRDLRACAPELLACLAGHDEVVVSLPLADIVRQLDRSCFQRQNQVSVEVPAAVPAVFLQTSTGATIAPPPAETAPAGQGGRPVVRASVTNTTTTPVAAAAPQPTKVALSPQALAALAAAQSPKPATAPAAIAPAPAPVAPAETVVQKPALRVAPSESSAPAAAVPAPLPAPNLPPQQPIAAPNLPPSSMQAPRVPSQAPAPVRAPITPIAPAAPVAPKADPSSQEAKLPVPVQKTFDVLPDEVRRELADAEVESSTFMLPMDAMQGMLRTGKVLFTWADLAACLQPPLPRQPSKSAGELLVELPLKVIAPIFMAHHRATTSPKKAQVGENIPDVFHSSTETNGAGAAARPAATAAPVSMPAAPARGITPAPSTAPAAPAAAPKPAPADNLPSSDQILGAPGQRHAPKQILQNITRLPGVTGALICLPDGLPVSAVVPTGIKADNIAAFVPQMYGRMSQYMKELGMGPLQSLTLQVEGGCWLVIKQPNIYFAVCGKAGETMPFNLLAQVAAELSKQSM